MMLAGEREIEKCYKLDIGGVPQCTSTCAYFFFFTIMGPKLLFMVISIGLIFCKEGMVVLGDIGTATSYDPPYLREYSVLCAYDDCTLYIKILASLHWPKTVIKALCH